MDRHPGQHVSDKGDLLVITCMSRLRKVKHYEKCGLWQQTHGPPLLRI
jgi:hypothetical protein